MNAVKQTCALTLTLVLGALGASCGGTDKCGNDGDKCGSDLDSGTLLDAGLDASSDASTYSCTSYTPATAKFCGGSHCEQSPATLRADTPSTAVCGTDDEVTSFCSLESVDVVGDCAVNAALIPGAPDTKTCAKAKLTKVRDTCLDCYVKSADCAKDNCLVECGANRRTMACDECRIKKGCIDAFYDCSGYKNPLPEEWQHVMQ